MQKSRLKNIINRSRGDTIIEVLFAITIFSLVVVSGLSIMNKGVAASQRALEISLVRQQIDAQAEVLRFINSSYISAYNSGIGIGPLYASGADGTENRYPPGSPEDQWGLMTKYIIESNKTNITDFGSIASGANCPSVQPAYSFAFNTKTASFEKLTNDNFKLASSFSQVRFKPSPNDKVVESYDGIWIEAIRHEQSPKYIDFHIRACWISIGQAIPVTIGTIVRLYEP